MQSRLADIAPVVGGGVVRHVHLAVQIPLAAEQLSGDRKEKMIGGRKIEI